MRRIEHEGQRSMRSFYFALLLASTVIPALGCRMTHPNHPNSVALMPPPEMPRELNKVVLPTYTIEPPDILVIEAINIVPRSPYILRTADLLAINVIGTLPDAPISGAFPIQPGGIVNLGLPYGAAKVSGLTIEDAQRGSAARSWLAGSRSGRQCLARGNGRQTADCRPAPGRTRRHGDSGQLRQCSRRSG